MPETREERFKRLAVLRTNVVLEKIRILGNLSNRANYNYSDDQVNKIFNTIEAQLKAAKARFVFKRKKEFSL
jgi:hypothetical protein